MKRVWTILEFLVLAGAMLYACATVPVRTPPTVPRSMLVQPEIINTGIVAEKERDGWGVVIYAHDGQKFVYHDEHLFYHFHVGQEVEMLRVGDKVMWRVKDRE